MTPEHIGALILFITLAVLTFDAYLYGDKIEGNSISQVVIAYSKKYIAIPFFIGFLMGHWFG